jgi:cytochrome oxidase Cu insertion factor (SCO1/SenC/PrrC family)
MRKFQFFVSTVALAAMLLSACGGTIPTPAVMMDKPTEAMMDKATATPEAMMSNDTATPDAMMKATATPDAMMKATATPDAMMNETATPSAMMDTTTPEAMMDATTPGAMMNDAAWFGATFTDASSGKTFSIDDYKGKVVLVETMAVWCTTCKQQQDNIKAFHTQLGMQSDLVTVSLDIDPNENLDTLKAYVNKTGFDWMYAVSPADVSREIAKLYGDQFLNPPSTPMLIIDRKGVAHPLPFGVKSADDLSKAVDQYLKDGM